MQRNYVRKRSKPPPSEDLLRLAIGEVMSGKSSIRKAAEKFHLCRWTVAYYSKRFSSNGLLPPTKVKLSEHSTEVIPPKYEADLAEYLKKCTLINHGLSPSETRVIAYSFATANRISTPRNWSKHGKASKDWLSFFLKRSFYDKSDFLFQQSKFKAHQILIRNETNTPTVMQPPKVTAYKGTKQVILVKCWKCDYQKFIIIIFFRFNKLWLLKGGLTLTCWLLSVLPVLPYHQFSCSLEKSIAPYVWKWTTRMYWSRQWFWVGDCFKFFQSSSEFPWIRKIIHNRPSVAFVR